MLATALGLTFWVGTAVVCLGAILCWLATREPKATVEGPIVSGALDEQSIDEQSIDEQSIDEQPLDEKGIEEPTVVRSLLGTRVECVVTIASDHRSALVCRSTSGREASVAAREPCRGGTAYDPILVYV